MLNTNKIYLDTLSLERKHGGTPVHEEQLAHIPMVGLRIETKTEPHTGHRVLWTRNSCVHGRRLGFITATIVDALGLREKLLGKPLAPKPPMFGLQMNAKPDIRHVI